MSFGAFIDFADQFLYHFGPFGAQGRPDAPNHQFRFHFLSFWYHFAYTSGAQTLRTPIFERAFKKLRFSEIPLRRVFSVHGSNANTMHADVLKTQ